MSDSEYLPWFNSPLNRARPSRSKMQYIEMDISMSGENPGGIRSLSRMVCDATIINRRPYLSRSKPVRQDPGMLEKNIFNCYVVLLFRCIDGGFGNSLFGNRFACVKVFARSTKGIRTNRVVFIHIIRAYFLEIKRDKSVNQGTLTHLC